MAVRVRTVTINLLEQTGCAYVCMYHIRPCPGQRLIGDEESDTLLFNSSSNVRDNLKIAAGLSSGCALSSAVA
jgi:hypothetical protein